MVGLHMSEAGILTRAAFGLTICTVLGLVGCAPSPATKSGQEPAQIEAGTEVAQVERGTITSVVVVPGTVEATPSYAVVAPEAGTVTFSAHPGQRGTSVIAAVGETSVTLGHPGALSERLVDDGQKVDARVPIATARYAGFGVPVRVPAEQAFRIYEEPTLGRVNIDAGPSGVECTLAPFAPNQSATGAGQTGNGEGSDIGQQSSMIDAVCLLPMGTKAVAGLGARVGLRTGTAKNVLSLPLTAVSGSTQQGEVWLLENGSESTRSGTQNARVVPVTLGITDGVRIEILTGLREHDTVLARPPRIPQ